jgi:hypothetical protein
MDEAGLKNLLETTGLPVAYHHWNTPPELPYILYMFNGSDNFAADNKVYVKNNNYRIELYSDYKDIASELIIETALDNANIYWEKSEVWIQSEKMYEVIYEI